MTSPDYFSQLRDRAHNYAGELDSRRKGLAPPEFWYPYRSMANFDHLDQLLTGSNRNLLRDIQPKRAIDVGGGDGDVSFFLEQEGWDMTVVDNPPTNWNGLRGAKLYKEATGSQVQIHEMDLDSQFKLDETYGLTFMLGILYHLQNPFYVLQQLSQHSKYALLSTRVMRWSGPAAADAVGLSTPQRQLLEDLPVAYLLAPEECNNDSTNYWIFSDTGFRRILDRTNWNILDYTILGDAAEGDPFTNEHDARAFCLVQSRVLSGDATA